MKSITSIKSTTSTTGISPRDTSDTRGTRETRLRGFTLIELLIVIAIIGILAALIMANFVGIRQRARDGQRKADLRTMQSAFELYRADQGGYPLYDIYANCSGAITPPGRCDIIYLKKVPIDPLGAYYGYNTPDEGYRLVACLENANDGERDHDPVVGCTTSYTLTNP